MMRRPTTAFAVLLTGATFFGGVVAVQAGGQDNRDVPTDEQQSDDVAAAPIEVLTEATAFDPNLQIYNVPAAAFTPDGANAESQFFPFGGGYFRGNTESYGCMVAPVNLPQGARITRLVGFLWDNSATYSASFSLRSTENDGNGGLNMATVSTPVESASVQTPAETNVLGNVVDNSQYSYFISGCVLDDDIRVYAIQLTFQEVLVDDPHSPVLVPVTPFRVYDSRMGDGPLTREANRLISVKNSIDLETGDVVKANAVPAEATAIMFNLAITNTVGAGFVAVTPGFATSSSSASINWSASGQTFNNGTFVRLDSQRRVKVFVDGAIGAQTDFIIDITGYLIAD